MATRTDIHRPGAIIPADYRIVLSYSLATSQDGWPIPSINVNCELDHRHTVRDADGVESIVNGTHHSDGNCCIVAMLGSGKKFAHTGGTGQCSVCSTHFVYGDVWEHIPTGEYIHVGHNCADKYRMLADRSEYELALGRVRAAAAVACEKAMRKEARESFLAKHEGLEKALEADHRIVRDIKERFMSFSSLSDKQIALVMKLAHEVSNPQPQEKLVSAPISGQRVTFSGMVVSAKVQEGAYGTQYKMTVKVSTQDGNWLAWGTVPSALLDDPSLSGQGLQGLRGRMVEITAKLKAGRDAHFAILDRPIGKFVRG